MTSSDSRRRVIPVHTAEDSAPRLRRLAQHVLHGRGNQNVSQSPTPLIHSAERWPLRTAPNRECHLPSRPFTGSWYSVCLGADSPGNRCSPRAPHIFAARPRTRIHHSTADPGMFSGRTATDQDAGCLIRPCPGMSQCFSRATLNTLRLFLRVRLAAVSARTVNRDRAAYAQCGVTSGGAIPGPSPRWSSRTPCPRPARVGGRPASRHRRRTSPYPYRNMVWRAQMGEVGNTAARPPCDPCVRGTGTCRSASGR